MKIRSEFIKEMNQHIAIAATIFCAVFIFYSCQNKKTAKTMNNENINKQPADSGRLLSVANLEQADSGRKVIAWFFETPQVFEFRMGSDQSLLVYKLLKDAKEKQIPINVRSITDGGINIIENVLPATDAQIKKPPHN
jgi:hypothetical protein